MKIYYNIDTDSIWTEEEIRKEFDALKRNGELEDFYEDNFEYYLNSCLTINNGSIREITDDDAKMVSAETFYYIPGKYGDVQIRGKTYYGRKFRLKDTIDNAKEINWDGVNFVMIDEDENRIFQASGYTRDRGLFCDLY